MSAGLRTRAALLLACVALVGCDAGGLEPLRPDSGLGGDGSMPLGCEDEAFVRATVFAPHCGSSDCHDSDRPRAGLDLISEGVRERLEAARSVHDACADRALVVPGVAQASFLVDKVLANEGECGDPMPVDGSLPLEARRCLVEWIAAMR